MAELVEKAENWQRKLEDQRARLTQIFKDQKITFKTGRMTKPADAKIQSCSLPDIKLSIETNRGATRVIGLDDIVS